MPVQSGESVPVIRRPAPGLEVLLLGRPMLWHRAHPAGQGGLVNVGRKIGDDRINELGLHQDLRIGLDRGRPLPIPLRTPAPGKLTLGIHTRAAGLCAYCERPFPAKALTMDHIVPLARGGRSNKGNLVPACKDCNNKKKLATPAELVLMAADAAKASSDTELE